MIKRLLVLGLAISLITYKGLASSQILSYGTHMTPSNPVINGGLNAFRENLLNKSNQRLEIDFQLGGSIVKERTVLDGIEFGIVSAGYVVDAYVPTQLPHSALINDLGMNQANILAATLAVTELQLLHCDGCQRDLDLLKVKTMGIHRTSDYYLLCRENIKSTEDLKGKRIKSTGNWNLLVLNLDASPVNIPTSDTYEALQRGIIDCAIAPLYWLRTLSLWDVSKTVLDMPLGAFQGGHLLVLNRGEWDSLGNNEKELIVKSMPQLLMDLSKYFLDINNKVKEEARDHGVNYIKPDISFRKKFSETNSEVIKNTMTRAVRARIDSSEDIIKKYNELLLKWELIIAQEGTLDEKIKNTIYQEIYSKVIY
ncbi:TRAP transporter substrate-binding protein DctP [Alcaligenes sp. 13f]|uniref:TRAP transporter substrate-binding protein DctP n=1 Tax=Alcaligenes sp. 13f TaxID=2841924 RepID=UPI001CF6BE5A|nr:TRAP transporter substrate-binding protein DctP [Alcaligenes sp. 13f]MCB4321561.1 TRAP transporter substrate-binding protein DctP [Alcaligenes sp. 13f]